jgi:lipopolysaccharide biosynthesis glycosyltransferase
MHNFEKLIYLDSDIIVQTDIAGLFNTDLSEFTIGAVRDFAISKIEKDDELFTVFKGLYSYLKNTLKIERIDRYFNSGVLVMDVKKLLEKNYFEKFIGTGKINNKLFHDQNIFNCVLAGDVKLLDPHWNLQLNNRGTYVLEIADYNNAKILHFCSAPKPWAKNNGKILQDIYWWEIAKESPFFDEIILFRMQPNLPKYSKEIKAQAKKSVDLSKIIVKKNKIRFNYYRTKILSAVTVGKTRNHYNNKKNFLKQQLREIRQLAK